MLRADSAALNSIAVLSNDADPDGDKLTVTITEAASVGTATVNTDGTVRLDSLPSGFKGVTRFRYRVADPAGQTATATAVVYVGTDPFRVLFAGDANANGNYEVYLTNFQGTPTAVTGATEGTRRLAGFVASNNGATVVYRRADSTNAAITDLSFVQTAKPTQQVRVTLPAGTTLASDGNGSDQYVVSPDGNWIAFVAKDGTNATAAYILNVATPTAVTKANIANIQSATKLHFANNSKNLYLLATATGADAGVYVVDLASNTATMVSASGAGTVFDYAVSPDQSRIAIHATRPTFTIGYIDATHLGVETGINHDMSLGGESIGQTTLSLSWNASGGTLGRRMAYRTKVVTLPYTIAYVTDISATPNAHMVANWNAGTLSLLGMRPDDGALLYSKEGQVREVLADGTADQALGAGFAGWYDSTGNIVVMEQALPSGGTPSSYNALAATTRGAFGTTQALGTAGMAASFFDVSGVDRGIVILGEGGTTGPAPTTARLALVNALAPDKLLYLADFQSPLKTIGVAQVVTN